MMTHVQSRVIAALRDRRDVQITINCRRALLRLGFVECRGADLVVTSTGRAVHDAFVRRQTREYECAEDFAVINGERVDLRVVCAGCGRQFGSHLNKPGNPLPKAKCPGYTAQRAAS